MRYNQTVIKFQSAHNINHIASCASDRTEVGGSTADLDRHSETDSEKDQKLKKPLAAVRVQPAGSCAVRQLGPYLSEKWKERNNQLWKSEWRTQERPDFTF